MRQQRDALERLREITDPHAEGELPSLPSPAPDIVDSGRPVVADPVHGVREITQPSAS